MELLPADLRISNQDQSRAYTLENRRMRFMPVKAKTLVLSLLFLLGVLSFILIAPWKDVPRVEENVSYGTAQGEPLLLDVIQTPASSLRPAIVFVHGGGWRAGDKKDFRTLAQGFARRGYVSFVLNY